MRRLFCVCFSFMFCTTAFSDECPKGYGYASYEMLEYIESTGTQFIDTGYSFVSNKGRIATAFMSYYRNDPGLNNRLCGSYDNFNRGLPIYVWPELAIGTGKQDIQTHFTISGGQKYSIDITADQGILYYNIEGFSGSNTYTGTIVSDLNMYLFSENERNINKWPFTGRIYYFQLYDNNHLVRSFIPVKHLSDNAIGMYDMVENKFYGNDGTGDFIAGPPRTGGSISAEYDVCAPCPPNTYKDFVGDAECTPCPGPLVSPQGSTSVNDCGNVLWIGDKIFFMPSAPRTVHTLNVMDSSGNIFYGNLYSEQ